MEIKKITLFWVLILFIIIGCKEDPLPDPDPDPEPIKEQAPALTRKINKFIKDAMEDVYLWTSEVPDIDHRYEFDSKAFFKKLVYIEDKWSYVTDDIQSLLESFEGVETSFGYSLAFGRFSNTGNIFAIVEFVYPDTPASEAGLKRGDIIVLNNGDDMTDANYRELLNAGIINISLGILGQGGISVDSKVISMTARKLKLDPVLIADVVEHEGHKIGYLFYAQFITDFNSSLDSAFQFFTDEGITDLVVDLRYNPGGYTSAAQHFCSSVAPLSAVNTKSTLVTFRWNEKYQRYWESNNVTSQLQIRFVDNTRIKMGLNRIFFLTGRGTASASELCITGLIPYMQEVVLIGESTYGKYTGSITIQPEDYYEQSYFRDFENWGIQPIVLRYANSLGVTDFKDGFQPDIPVEDDLFAGIQLGDKQDPLLKAAIELITGTEIVAMKKARVVLPYTIFDRGFSKFDPNKREMIFDQAEIQQVIR